MVKNELIYTQPPNNEPPIDSQKMTKSRKYQPVRAGRSQWLNVRDVRYHLLEWGNRDNPLLVMLHGWGDCAASFQFVVDELQRDWFVVAPDWRGFGRSHHRCDGYWFPDYLADLDVILDHYQRQSAFDLLGHSMGANIAGLYAGVFPDRVRSFVSVEGFGLTDGDPANAPANYRRWIAQKRSLPVYSTYADFGGLAERIVRRAPAMTMDKAHYVAEHWAYRDDSGDIVLRADPAHKMPNAVLYRRAEAMACWAQVTARVLMIAGEGSELASAAQKLAQDDASSEPFADAETVVLAGCGHMIHFEQAAMLAQAVETFLSTDD